MLDFLQNEAIKKLNKLKTGALFMKMGTGKTKVALELANLKKDSFKYIIWIAPASLIKESSYHTEIKKWKNNLYNIIKFFTIESISMSDNKYLKLYELAKNNKVFCIIDESITIKNTEAGRTKRLLDIWNLFEFRLILNGTPLTQGLIDLYSQIQFIHPKILNMTESQFANNFLIYKKEGYRPWKRWSCPENEEALIEIIRPYIFNCDLYISCKKNIFHKNFNLTENEQFEYKQNKELFLRNKFQIEFLTIAQKFQNFYTNCFNKRKYLKFLLNEINNRKEKVIIYIKFLNEVSYIKDNFNCVEFTGKNKENLEIFKNKKNILLCTYGVGSMGLNLQYCNNIIYFSQTFDYKDKIQSLHRIYRNGQKKDINVYNFWVNTGLDKIIKRSLNKKQNLLSNIERIITKEKALEL